MTPFNFAFPALSRIQHTETGDRYLVTSRVIDVDYDTAYYVLAHISGPSRGHDAVMRAATMEKYYTVIPS